MSGTVVKLIYMTTQEQPSLIPQQSHPSLQVCLIGLIIGCILKLRRLWRLWRLWLNWDDLIISKDDDLDISVEDMRGMSTL